LHALVHRLDQSGLKGQITGMMFSARLEKLLRHAGFAKASRVLGISREQLRWLEILAQMLHEEIGRFRAVHAGANVGEDSAARLGKTECIQFAHYLWVTQVISQ